MLPDLHFLISWKDEEDVFDVLDHKMIRLEESIDVVEVSGGRGCVALYCGKEFEAVIIATG